MNLSQTTKNVARAVTPCVNPSSDIYMLKGCIFESQCPYCHVSITTHAHTNTHAHAQTHTHTHKLTHTHLGMHLTHTDTWQHTHTCMHTHKYTHTYTHTHTHTNCIWGACDGHVLEKLTNRCIFCDVSVLQKIPTHVQTHTHMYGQKIVHCG